MLISNKLLGDSPSLPQTMTSISINYEWVMYKIKTHNIVNFFMNLNMPKNVCMNDHIHVLHFVLEFVSSALRFPLIIQHIGLE